MTNTRGKLPDLLQAIRSFLGQNDRLELPTDTPFGMTGHPAISTTGAKSDSLPLGLVSSASTIGVRAGPVYDKHAVRME